MFYILLFFLVIFFLKRSKYIYLNLLLILVAGFRYNVGSDYWNYVNNFLLQDLESYEFGFKILNKILYYFSSNSQILFIICALINITFIYYGIKNYKINTKITYFIYFCIYYLEPNFNLLRHGMAMSICYYALSLKKMYKRIFFILLASLFHKIALILLPIIFLKKIRIREYIFILCISIIIYCFNINILKILYSNDLIFNDYLAWKIKVYLYKREIISAPLTIGFIYRQILIIICLFNLKLFKNYEENIKILLLSSISFFLFSSSGVFYERIANLLFMFEINILSLLFINKNKIFKIVIFCIVTMYFFKISYKKNTELGYRVYQKRYKYIPYKMKFINKDIKFMWDQKNYYYKQENNYKNY